MTIYQVLYGKCWKCFQCTYGMLTTNTGTAITNNDTTGTLKSTPYVSLENCPSDDYTSKFPKDELHYSTSNHLISII